MIEAGAALLISAMALGLLLQIARSSIAHLWFDHALYEALICVAQNEDVSLCKKQAQAKAKQLPLGSHKIQIELRKNGQNWQGEIQWQGPLNLRGRKQLRLQLAQIAIKDSRSSACCF